MHGSCDLMLPSRGSYSDEISGVLIPAGERGEGSRQAQATPALTAFSSSSSSPGWRPRRWLPRMEMKPRGARATIGRRSALSLPPYLIPHLPSPIPSSFPPTLPPSLLPPPNETTWRELREGPLKCIGGREIKPNVWVMLSRSGWRWKEGGDWVRSGGPDSDWPKKHHLGRGMPGGTGRRGWRDVKLV
ncbi:hypothetical protein E2C01_042027 [Portunus trituberculatus]|uniref:Uncharacterized protein n=1 Tax=Portunus trituberculatus TaxID=210409 RepID=A0A5B7FTG0_PORTR|nr:hypothetical protein [Portunus trituberculatus]